MKRRGRVTLADVAREAGVSTQTVSRVINQKGEISAETRERIQEVIEYLGYRPNRVAQALARQRSDVIGLVVPDITSPFYADVVRGVEDVAHQHDYRVFLCNIVEVPARELEAIRSFEDYGVDGIILAGSRLSDETLTQVVKRNPNIVLHNRKLPDNTHPYVVRNDDHMGGYIATHYLIEHGHRTICFLGGQPNSFSRRERIAGYRRALEEASIPVDEGLLFEGFPYLETGRELFKEALVARPDISAVLAYNDLVAVGALQAYKETEQPDTPIAFVGFDDILMARMVSPPLTTVRMAKRAAGIAAMKMMLHCLEDEDWTAQEVVFDAELIIRESA